MRRILRTLLHSFGPVKCMNPRGATALDKFSHYDPDIVITDWAMPIYDGLDLSQCPHRMPTATQAPIII